MDIIKMAMAPTVAWLMNGGAKKVVSSLESTWNALDRKTRRAVPVDPDLKAFSFAVEEERRRMLAEDERVKRLSDDAQRKLAEEMLRKHLPDRIGAIDDNLAKIEHVIKKNEKSLATAVSRYNSAVSAQQKYEQKKLAFAAAVKNANRLNGFYQEYLAACGKNGKLDDIGEFIVREAAQKAGVTNAEMADVRRFAVSHGFDKTVAYISEPVKPAAVDKHEDIDKLKSDVDRIAGALKEVAGKKDLLVMVRSALQRRMA